MMNVKEHWQNVCALGCIVSGRPNPTIHHCHSGSMTEIPNVNVLRGISEKTNDWLVIPLDWEFHVGRWGIDGGMGVEEWEILFGRQLDHLKEVSKMLGYNVFKLAGIEGIENA